MLSKVEAHEIAVVINDNLNTSYESEEAQHYRKQLPVGQLIAEVECLKTQGAEESWDDYELEDGTTIAINTHDIDETGIWSICAYTTSIDDKGYTVTNTLDPIFEGKRIDWFEPHVVQRKDLLKEDLSIPVKTMEGREYYLQLVNPTKYERLESEKDDEYSIRIHTPNGTVKAIPADLDFID